MLVLMKCIAEAVAAKGVKGLAEWVPGGPYLYDVGHDALRRLRERRRHEQLRDEIRLAAEASFAETQRAAAEVVREVVPIAPVEDRVALELYLSQVPGAVRRSLRRADDPTGRTVPPGFALNTPDDLVKLLPPQMPRFRTGDDVPGRLGWKLTEPLGAGGFGEVWRVENPENGEEWAVKFCTNAAARHRLLKHEQVLVKRVQREAPHPHIVKLKDALLLETVEVPWLAYEYVGGGDLAGLILSWQRLSADERLSLALETLAVLASTAGHFHRLNPPIVHRDLKPANILRDAATGQLRVTDFGIGGIAAANLLSGSRDGATAYTRAVSMLSGAYTPIYASPQQQRGDAPDPRDDVHALGVIAYQMFTGRLDAGPGPKFERDLQKLSVPADVIQLIGDCVDPVPEDRIADGGAILARLETGTFGAKQREAEQARQARQAQAELAGDRARGAAPTVQMLQTHLREASGGQPRSAPAGEQQSPMATPGQGRATRSGDQPTLLNSTIEEAKLTAYGCVFLCLPVLFVICVWRVVDAVDLGLWGAPAFALMMAGACMFAMRAVTRNLPVRRRPLDGSDVPSHRHERH